MHDAIRVKLRTFNGQLAMTQITREEVAALLADRDALAKRVTALERIDLNANRFYRCMNGLDEDDHDKRAERFMVQTLDGLAVGPSNRTSVKAALAEHFAAVAERAEAERDALAKERDAVAVANCPRLCAEFCNEFQTQRALEQAEEARDALARDLAAARGLLHGLLAGVDEDCGDGGCDDCEAWRPIRAFLAATPEREPGAACTCIHPPGHPCEPAWDCPVHS
jgi:hypothetical protein